LLSRLHADAAPRRGVRRRPRVCLRPVSPGAGAAHPGAVRLLGAGVPGGAAPLRSRSALAVGGARRGRVAAAGAVERLLPVLPFGRARVLVLLVRPRTVAAETVGTRGGMLSRRRVAAGARADRLQAD